MRKSLLRYTDFGVDISEDKLMWAYPTAFALLLRDNTTSTEKRQRNIFWATCNYEVLGEGFEYNDPITLEHISDLYGKVIMPRVLKDTEKQRERVKDKAEVFTPSWICNAQNNLIDEAWFERKEVFNTENDNHKWTTNSDKITFPKGKTWYDYVRDTRLEITCGEAPYLVSRYDTVTGEYIPIENRIGLLDRKLRVVSENTDKSPHWIEWAKNALKSVYGYEWQGDSLLIARESLFVTFIEYYIAKFGEQKFHHVKGRTLPEVAKIISWNIWQMDGLKGVVPGSCGAKPTADDMFGSSELRFCEGCQSGDIINGIKKHNGIYCFIKDWSIKNEDKQAIRYVDLIETNK